MIDSKTEKRVTVFVDETYGPYIEIFSYQDSGALEDVLDEKYYVLYWTEVPKNFECGEWKKYFFGGAADPVKLQSILDEIDFQE